MPIIFVNPAGHRKGKSKKRKHTRITRRNPVPKGSKKKKPAKKSAAKKPAKRRMSTKQKKAKLKKQIAAAKKLLAGSGYRAKLRTKVVERRDAAKKKAKEARDAKIAAKKKKAADKADAKRLRKIAAAEEKAAKYEQMLRKLKGALPNPARRRRRKHNPARHHHRRSHRRYRRNPSGFVRAIMGVVKMAAPAVASMLAGKALSAQAIKRVPMLGRAKGFEKVIVDVALLAAAHYGAGKVAVLRKYQTSIMVGLGVNLIVDGLSAVLPADIKSQIGLSGEGIYDRALSDYVTTSDYLTTGAMPIDDDIALADYVTTGAIEAELGLSEELGISEELGLSEELGAIDAHTVRGGVSQTAMLKTVPHQSFSEEIPARSFTKEVSHAGQGFDNPGALYAGIFRGGF